jgi:hypothetical protein
VIKRKDMSDRFKSILFHAARALGEIDADEHGKEYVLNVDYFRDCLHSVQSNVEELLEEVN